MKSSIFDPTRWGCPALGVAFASLGAGCGNDLDPASRVNTLRVLAVRADLPYARPGETVSLDTLSHDPEGRTLTWGWAACENPEDSSTLGCVEALRRRAAHGDDVRLTTGDSLDRFTITVPGDALTRSPEPLPGRAVEGIVAVACPGTLEDQLESDTTPAHPLPFVCRDDRGRRLSTFDFVVGMKRVFVRAADRNANPEIARVTFDGKDWPDTRIPEVSACDKQTNTTDDCDPTLRHRIEVNATPENAESGTDETGESFEEQLVVQYYADDGTFADDVRVAASPKTEWVATPSARGKEVHFWLVLRDDRGGVSWAERRVHVAG
jgi:hypothetical protein